MYSLICNFNLPPVPTNLGGLQKVKKKPFGQLKKQQQTLIKMQLGFREKGQ